MDIYIYLFEFENKYFLLIFLKEKKNFFNHCSFPKSKLVKKNGFKIWFTLVAQKALNHDRQSATLYFCNLVFASSSLTLTLSFSTFRFCRVYFLLSSTNCLCYVESASGNIATTTSGLCFAWFNQQLVSNLFPATVSVQEQGAWPSQLRVMESKHTNGMC